MAQMSRLSEALAPVPQGQAITPHSSTLEIVVAQRVVVARHIPDMIQRVKALASVAGEHYYYRFPVNKKNPETGEKEKSWIEGPSIKLANDLAREYGNCAVETRVVELDTSWVIYARFVDWERGYALTRPFQQRKAQVSIGTKDVGRQQDIALQIGVSKAIRNVVVNALETYAELMLDEAREGLIGKVAKNLENYRRRVGERLQDMKVPVKRVEAQVGRTFAEWDERHVRA
ncbi:MAG: hypothetical protein HC889_16140 [Synechococcaceae cyanobacterium SM1_2_3]|nr:hypothetical protein [Synechococcaceae cyanobacterium SM1_2_3]